MLGHRVQNQNMSMSLCIHRMQNVSMSLCIHVTMSMNLSLRIPSLVVDIGSAALQYRCTKKLCTLAVFSAGGAAGPEMSRRRRRLGGGICSYQFNITKIKSTLLLVKHCLKTEDPSNQNAIKNPPRPDHRMSFFFAPEHLFATTQPVLSNTKQVSPGSSTHWMSCHIVGAVILNSVNTFNPDPKNLLVKTKYYCGNHVFKTKYWTCPWRNHCLRFSFQTHVAKTKVGCLDRFSPGPKKPDIVSTGSWTEVCMHTGKLGVSVHFDPSLGPSTLCINISFVLGLWLQWDKPLICQVHHTIRSIWITLTATLQGAWPRFWVRPVAALGTRPELAMIELTCLGLPQALYVCLMIIVHLSPYFFFWYSNCSKLIAAKGLTMVRVIGSTVGVRSRGSWVISSKPMIRFTISIPPTEYRHSIVVKLLVAAPQK